MAGLAGALRNCALPLPAQLGPRHGMALTGGIVAVWVGVRATRDMLAGLPLTATHTTTFDVLPAGTDSLGRIPTDSPTNHRAC